mmetsp:Transcript_25348/g.46779  ORF Transcript_25348/g.46779 Transcript_25348/m.46779 type:complete len:486 (+) Transcript_25348:70-1527(+)
MPTSAFLSWSEDEAEVAAETVDGSSVYDNEESKQEVRELDLALLFPDCVIAQPDQESVAGSSAFGHEQNDGHAQDFDVSSLFASAVTAQTAEEERDTQVQDGRDTQGFHSSPQSETVIDDVAQSHTEATHQSSALETQHERLRAELGVQCQEMEAQIAAHAMKFQSLLDDRVATAVRELNVVISQRAEAVEGCANHVFATVEQRLDTFVTKLESLIARQSLDLKAAQDESEEQWSLRFDDMRVRLTASEEQTSHELKKLETALEQQIGDLDSRIRSETERRLAKMEEQFQFQSECAKLGEPASKSQEEKTLLVPSDLESRFDERLQDLEHKLQSGLESVHKEIESVRELAKSCLSAFEGPAAGRLQQLSERVDKVKAHLHLQDVDVLRQDDDAECGFGQPPAQAWPQRRPQSATSIRSQPHQHVPRRPQRPSSAKSEYGRPFSSIQSCPGAVKDDSVRLHARQLLADSVAMQLELGGGARAIRPS